MPNRAIWLGVIGLALVVTGRFVFLNWGAVSQKTEATLFRWGELMSIGAELKARYGVEPDMTYDTSTSDRALNIRFRDYRLPEQITAEGHAREIAVFAVGTTTKFKQIDVVTVLFENDGSGSYTFALDDLITNRTQAAP